jgi:hypothetical protein
VTGSEQDMLIVPTHGLNHDEYKNNLHDVMIAQCCAVHDMPKNDCSVLVSRAEGSHLIPSRTQQLSPPAPMVVSFI